MAQRAEESSGDESDEEDSEGDYITNFYYNLCSELMCSSVCNLHVVACRSYSDKRSGGRGASMNNCRSQL